jgi:predicted XRE-type DNA-binding protein
MAKKRRMSRDVRVTLSTGNVFRDLGFSEDESAHLLVRSDLMIEVQKFIAARRLTQAQVAKILHVTQPRVSDLLRGRVDLFSTDTLLDMLGRLGVQVRFVLKPSRRKLQVA